MPPKHRVRSNSKKYNDNLLSNIENDQLPDANVMAWGVKRPSYGTLGEPISVISNVRRASISQTIIYQYDVVISLQRNGVSRSPRHQGFWPTKRDEYNVMQRLQEVIAPEIFTPRGVYDGGKNFYASHELDFGDSDSREFEIQLPEEYQNVSLLDQNFDTSGISAPRLRVFNVRLTMVNEIDTGVLAEFLSGKHAHDGEVSEALTVFNVIIQAVPSIRLNHPCGGRPFKFLIDDGIKDVGKGVVAWRAYIQSARPGIARMLINIDMSMGFMHKPGRLIDICLEFLGISENDPRGLVHLEDHKHTSLEQFLKGLQVLVHVPVRNRFINIRPRPYTIKELSKLGANEIRTQTGGGAIQGPTVAQIFQQIYNQPLVLPQLPCITVKTATQIPLELCDVIPGQTMRSWVSPESNSMSHSFSSKNPWERLEHICEGVAVLERGQSSYVGQFGINLENQTTPLNARMLDQVPLKFGRSFGETIAKVSNGSWNMTDKRVYQPATIRGWAVTIFETESRFGRNQARNLIQNLFSNFRRLGINIFNSNPPVHWCNGQGSISDQIRNCVRIKPDLLIVVLPPGGGEIYKAVKHLGDVQTGVATQCLQNRQYSFRPSMLELEPSSPYYTNICLKINAKLGGINTVPESSYTGMNLLTDPEKPTIIMGAHVVHPAPDLHGQPSFASVVGNIDSDTVKYVADTRLQTPRSEIIEGLSSMTVHILNMWKKHHELSEKKPESNNTNMPKRIILYRSGVSDSLYQIVLSHELPSLKDACRVLGINAKISIVVVSKPNRTRFFPNNRNYDDTDWSINLPPGTVIDRKVVHPVEFDFYLLSHGCKYGTSHPTHYNVIHDENNLTPNDLQSLTYALTHMCARSTNSLSVPAPVHYARLANAQAKNRYKPNFEQELFQEDLQGETNMRIKGWVTSFEKFKQEFKPLHAKQRQQMYFC